MLNQRQRLVGLYILYGIYLHENVKTTPFYQIVLTLLSQANSLHAAEQKLLADFLRSVPKVGKQTPIEFIKGVEKPVPGKFNQDLEPYRKAHTENMPHTNLLQASEVINILHQPNDRKALENLNKYNVIKV
jgi:hypothetical protein